MSTAPESRALSVIVAVIVAAGAGSSVIGVAAWLTAAVLLGAGLGWLTVAMLRRERRIRARLADPRTHPHPRSVAAGRSTSGVA